MSSSGTEIKVGVLESRGTPRANLIYLHGFADTMDNHQSLLTALRGKNIRIIAFDYPGHGQSGGKIADWGLMDLAQILPDITANAAVDYDASLPVILAGWSTGATISIRIAQAWASKVLPAGTQIAGVIAFAPALPARVVINVNKSDLTSGSMKHDPNPNKVPISGQFATSITVVSRTTAGSNMPADIPALVLVADNADSFANSQGSVSWVTSQSGAAFITGFQCTGAKHGIEFEPGIGPDSRAIAVQFADSILNGTKSPVIRSSKCAKL